MNFVSLFSFCRREAYSLHTNIVVSLGAIFMYVSVETGRIRTKLGRGMGNREGVTLKFLTRSLLGPWRSSQTLTFFLMNTMHRFNHFHFSDFNET